MLRNLNSDLYKNSVFLILSSLIGAGTGFFFWILAAKIYPAEAVGISSAIVSAMRLLSLLSILGLDLALVRYIPESEDRVSLINSSMFTVCAISVFLSFVFFLLIDITAPNLRIIKGSVFVIFVVFTLSLSLSDLIGQGIFVGFRKAKYTFIQSVSSLLRLLILPLLLSYGALGIFISFGIGVLISSALGFALVFRLVTYKLKLSRAVGSLIHYSLGVYVARIFEMMPSLLLPLIVLNILGAEINAYFFIAWSIMFFTTMIARNTAMSLLAEGSYDPAGLKEKTLKSLKFVFVILFFTVTPIYVFGEKILVFFGRNYAENALEVLRLLLLGCVPHSFNTIFASTMMVLKNLRRVISIYGGMSVITILAGYFLMLNFGFIGVGYAWILANLFVFLYIMVTVNVGKAFI